MATSTLDQVINETKTAANGARQTNGYAVIDVPDKSFRKRAANPLWLALLEAATTHQAVLVTASDGTHNTRNYNAMTQSARRSGLFKVHQAKRADGAFAMWLTPHVTHGE